MRGQVVSGVCLLSTLLSTVSASATPDGVISFPFQKERLASRGSRLRRRATGETETPYTYQNSAYIVGVSVGTPPQRMQMQMDTGSSDVWLTSPGACTSKIAAQANLPNCGGTYDISKSTSAKTISTGTYNMSYISSQGATGNYITDDFTLGNFTALNLIMGDASAVYDPPATFGLSFDATESSNGFGSGSQNIQGVPAVYPGILSSFVNQGLIASRAFSIWHQSLTQSSGTVLLGGIDTDAIVGGKLTTIPMQNASPGSPISDYNVALTSIGVTDSTGSNALTSSDYPIISLLDTGTGWMELPNDLFGELASYFGAVYDGWSGQWVVDCHLGAKAGSLDFQFSGVGGPVVGVPFSELVLPAHDASFKPVKNPNGQPACWLGIQPSGGASATLGDTFLRSAYVFFDQDNLEIGLGQTNFNQKSSNIVLVTSNATSLGEVTDVNVLASPVDYSSPASQPTPSSISMGPDSAGHLTAIPVSSLNAQALAATPTSYSQPLPTVTNTGSGNTPLQSASSSSGSSGSTSPNGSSAAPRSLRLSVTGIALAAVAALISLA